MDEVSLRELLQSVSAGTVGVEEAMGRLKTLPFQMLEEGRLDQHRALRRGFPEVILGEGKSPGQVAVLLEHLQRSHPVVLCTRATSEHWRAVRERVPHCHYDPIARVLFCAPVSVPQRGRGSICVVSAGTADLPVAREAWWTATLMGNATELVLDVGVAGLHRVLNVLDQLAAAEVLVVVAGMEGALPSVLGGLCDRPIIAVPTSVGYGSGREGIPALLAMLNSCVAGIAVVNIDNGFGAGYAASLINRCRGDDSPHQREALDLKPHLARVAPVPDEE